MTLSFTFDLLFIIAVIGGALALIDGIIRARGRVAIVAVLEIIASALFILSLFFSGIPLGSLILAIITVVLLVIALIVGGRRRAGVATAVIALILLVVWILLGQRWLIIPGING